MNILFKPDEKAVDIRRRRHLLEAIKKVKRISAVVLAWLAGAAVLYGVYTLAFIKPYFEVENIEVKGELKILTREEIIKDSGIAMGDHLLHIPVGEVQERLMKNQWIKEAAVHRKLPHMVWIYVKEHVPAAIIRTDDWYYADRSGNPFKKVGLGEDRDFAVFTGLDELAGAGKLNDLKSKIVELLKVNKLFEASELGEIYGLSEIHYSNNKGVSIITLNNPMELRLGFGPFAEKIERLEAVYPAIRSHGGIVAYVDLSPEGKVVVKYGI